MTPSYYGSPFNAEIPPPVPPLPNEHRSPIADMFTNRPSTPDVSKPLPPIQLSPEGSSGAQDENGDESDDDKSMVLIERDTGKTAAKQIRGQSPDRTIKCKSGRHASQTITQASHSRRRSMSVSEVDLQQLSTPIAEQNGNHRWDNNIHGIIRDFKGQLRQLDPISSSSLDLKDPATPKHDSYGHLTAGRPSEQPSSRRLPNPNIEQHPNVPSPVSPSAPDEIPSPTSPVDESSTVPTPAVSSVDEIVPSPRSVSLQAPVRSPSGSSTFSRRSGAVRYGPRQLRTASSTLDSSNGSTPIASQMNRDAIRLRVQHRSSASSSEPSLLHLREDDRNRDNKRTVRLVPSSVSMGWPEATSPALSICLSSQTDLTGEESASRFTSSAPSRLDEANGPDLDRRGKELANKCWTEDEDFLAREKIAEWLGGTYVSLCANVVYMRIY